MVADSEDQSALSLHQVLEQEFAILHGSNSPSNPDTDADTDPLAGIYSQIAAQRHSGLCISGGGIRSASFGLGVLQGLAKHGFLGKVDYLSTVSGGGYIGSWLSAWIHRHPNGRDGVIAELSDFRGAKIDPESEPIRRLREYSHYLTPQWGLLSADTWTWVAIFLRNLILNWLVLIPLLASVLAVPRVCHRLIDWWFCLCRNWDRLREPESSEYRQQQRSGKLSASVSVTVLMRGSRVDQFMGMVS